MLKQDRLHGQLKSRSDDINIEQMTMQLRARLLVRWASQNLKIKKTLMHRLQIMDLQSGGR